MNYIFENVTKNVFVLAVWDSSWNSYNNCYFIVEDHGVTVIDSGKLQHAKYVEDALHSIGKSVDDVALFIATHGHEDHVQAATLFSNAKKFIHLNEKEMIEYPDPEQFHYELPDQGIFRDFDCQLVGYHTPGSVIFYHRPTQVLFTGDFLCFFGDPLSAGGLVSEGKELREAWLDYLKDGGVAKEHLPAFLEGLKTIQSFESIAMCTGHGGVLVGDSKEFVSELLMVGTEKWIQQ
ncbi:MBL fold metallo-hydrolase [Neobacillus drentensis]|uniref:MBL fold metallo-hydrolase n=1 Tax=Neobacillus drentensis TaxID=220684 RepID=UPI0030022305